VRSGWDEDNKVLAKGMKKKREEVIVLANRPQPMKKGGERVRQLDVQPGCAQTRKKEKSTESLWGHASF